MSDAGGAPHYRLSILGQTLQETLDEMKEAELLNEQQCKLIFKHFENNLRTAIVETQQNVQIRGEISSYRNHNDIWDIVLKAMQIIINDKMLPVTESTKIISVPVLPPPE